MTRTDQLTVNIVINTGIRLSPRDEHHGINTLLCNGYMSASMIRQSSRFYISYQDVAIHHHYNIDAGDQRT